MVDACDEVVCVFDVGCVSQVSVETISMRWEGFVEFVSMRVSEGCCCLVSPPLDQSRNSAVGAAAAAPPTEAGWIDVRKNRRRMTMSGVAKDYMIKCM